ncbi:uncharacterized protein PV06_03222 [Exophiala oligosperma]|uniref:Tyrosine decarboxylase n=2 Tax=Chaetothyriales TaxID=34395 RepID=A0A0D2E9W8_9EURO|nr:uncharacterized protein PV06_03222 [Exophiala oligosperma]KAJ9642211.1 hypothetical protein H2204_002580 [Knufia peltigerae]KIW44774.1 hypothetical protein PV06_03222 [Exophiala oligosperma]
MDQSISITDVITALQQIVSDPNLPTSQVQSRDASSATPGLILPRDTPGLDQIQAQSNISKPLAAFAKSNPGPGSLQSLAGHLTRTILPNLNLASLSPNYYGFVIGGATPAALLGDFLASIYDQNVHVHLPAETISTTVEAATLNLLVQLFRLPREDWALAHPGRGNGGGIFTTGATASNTLGLALGREYVVRKALMKSAGAGTIESADQSVGECGLAELLIKAGRTKIQVLSTLPHSSIAKAASVVGIGRRNVVSVAVEDDPLRIDMDRLRHEASRPEVLNILAISAGEVNTGRFATDSGSTMRELRDICDEYGVWMHVDGAFGLFGRVLLQSARDDAETYNEIIRGVEGLELADSITGDCHKLLNVPYDCGVFFTRHKRLSEDVFGNPGAAYLKAGSGDGVQSPLNIGLENSRGFRALPVYCTLLNYGREGYVDMLKRQIDLARRVVRWLANDSRFEVLGPRKPHGETETSLTVDEMVAKTFMIVLFRPRDDEVNKNFVKDVNATGKIYISGTAWEGKPAARIAVSNWQADVQRDGDLIEAVLDQVAGKVS